MSNGKIWKVIESIWNIINDAYGRCKDFYPELVFHSDMKEQFNTLFKEKYTDVMNRFMTDGTDKLDSHKQAALLTICCLQLNLIECSEPSQNDSAELHIIPQIIAVNVGLSYMLQCLNDLLEKKKSKRRLKSTIFLLH